MAAASLGQVHRAALRDGRRVAVKVQRPGIREVIVKDLEALAEQDQATVLVELRWNGNTTAETDQFTLRTNDAGELLVASQARSTSTERRCPRRAVVEDDQTARRKSGRYRRIRHAAGRVWNSRTQ